MAEKPSCRDCWWHEGGRCYLEPCIRDEEGRSVKPATEWCDKFIGKRSLMRGLFNAKPAPDDVGELRKLYEQQPPQGGSSE